MYKNLKSILIKKNISQKNFAELLGVSEKTLANKLNGFSEFTLTEFKKSCSILNEYSPDYLFTKEEEG